MGWDGMGWDGMASGGMGCNGMGWPTRRTCPPVSEKWMTLRRELDELDDIKASSAASASADNFTTSEATSVADSRAISALASASPSAPPVGSSFCRIATCGIDCFLSAAADAPGALESAPPAGAAGVGLSFCLRRNCGRGTTGIRNRSSREDMGRVVVLPCNRAFASATTAYIQSGASTCGYRWETWVVQKKLRTVGRGEESRCRSMSDHILSWPQERGSSWASEIRSCTNNKLLPAHIHWVITTSPCMLLPSPLR